MNKEFKTYKEFLNESQELDQSIFPLEEPEEVKAFIEKHLVNKKYNEEYRLTGDWKVDEEGYFSTPGNLNISSMRAVKKKIPFKIKNIGGNFNCSHNALYDLEGLEKLEQVGGNFNCGWNNLHNLKELKNLESVGGYFECQSNNKLTSLEGLKKLQFVGKELHYSLYYYFNIVHLARNHRKFIYYFSTLMFPQLHSRVKVSIKNHSSYYDTSYEDGIKTFVSLTQNEQKKIITALSEVDLQAYRKLLSYAEENNIKLPLDKEVYKWNKEAKDLDDTGLEF
jgi:hypothetical protein